MKTAFLILAAAVQLAWRDPSPHTVKFITVDSAVRLEVLDWGGTGRPVMFLSCYVSGHQFDDMAPKLIDRFRVYALTRRGIGGSDRPADGYKLQDSVDDVRDVLDALNVRKTILAGHSCAGQVLTLFAAQHSDRLHGLVYLDGAGDPTMKPEDVGATMPDLAMLPRLLNATPPDHTSFAALRASQLRTRGWAFPEGELRAQFAANPDGSVGPSTLDPTIRRAITIDARTKPDYSRIRVPVLAIYQRALPFEQEAARYAIEDERQRAAMRQEYTATRALYTRWQQDLRAAVPTARIVDLPGAGLYMFLSHEADVIRELRSFAATLPPD